MSPTPRPGRAADAHTDASKLPRSEPEFPALTAMRSFDRQQHIERAIAAGLSREEAERHADEHVRSWSPSDAQRRTRED